ncbi:MAG TPA: oligosaccharide flippase family protein [Candidatus Saccharimonadales bacterium]|nr:oligosaccharide flippase family protein [Candidatus Saccharimonadales bacterium]
MQHWVRTIRQSQFLRDNAIYLIGSVVVGALNYLYYPVLGRLLPPSAFGEVQTLVSLFLQITIFLSVLGLITVNIVANYDDEQARNAVVLEFEKLAFVISAALVVLTIIFQSNLKEFLHFNSSWPFVILMLSVVATVPFTFRGAFVRGKKKFGVSAVSTIIGAGAKLLFSVLLVLAGFNTIGAIGGLILAQAVAAAYVAWWALRLGLKRSDGAKRSALPNFRVLLPELRYGMLVLVGSLVITLQYSLDILVVKHYFDAHTAGLYAGVASVARIIFFLTASIALVLMPSVRLHQPAAQNRKLLGKSLLLFSALSIPTLLFFIGFPKLVVGVLMGSSYESMAGLLPKLGVAICVIAILNLFVSYYLALRRYGIAVVVLAGGLTTYGLMLWHHASPSAVVTSLLTGSLAMVGLLVLWLTASKFLRKGTEEWRGS